MTGTVRGRFSAAAGPEELAELLREERARLCEATLGARSGPQPEAAPSGRAVCRALTESTDWTIQSLFSLAVPDHREREWLRTRVAVAAMGGYGRRELAPCSDIDVTFIVAEEEEERLDQAVRQVFLWLMQVFSRQLQLKVGYGYRTLADLPQIDHQSQTALLDARLVAGSPALFEQFTGELRRQIWPGAFVRRKIAERREVRARHQDTVYRIEPHLRDGCGALRDLHVAEWIATVTFPSTRGDVWRQLERTGVVSRRDAEQVQAAREFLLSLRNRMHFQAGRPADLLVRERQEGLAAAFGLRDEGGPAPVQQFMARFYEHAANVDRVTGFVVERVLAERLSLTPELAAAGDELRPAFPWVAAALPAFLVSLGEQFQEHGLRPALELRRMIAEEAAAPAGEGAVEAPGARFVALLQAPAKVSDTLALLASLGVLQRWLPEVGAAYRHVPLEAVHQYTVGHHSLQVVRGLEALRESADERLEDLRRVWSEVEGPELLFLAALLHDVGKVAGSGHAARGAAIAAAICARLGLDEPETGKVVALVEHHLLLSETSQLRDLTQPQTARDFAAVVRSRDLLNMLLLLTYADMEATGVLSPMKTRFLLDLYYQADAVLTSDFAPGMDEERLRKYRTRLSRRLSAANLSAEEIDAHCQGMPIAYLLNTPPDQIATHIRLVNTLKETGRPAMEFTDEQGAEYTLLTLCTFETPEPGLLSRLAGVLYAQEVGVHAARVFTREAGPAGEPALALDTLWIDFHGRPVPPLKRLEIEQALSAVLQGAPVEDEIARHRKHLPPPLPPNALRFDNSVAEHHTVLEVDAPDQPGLLYRLTRAIAALGWDIHSAKIYTTGDRARDAFYLTRADGARLPDDPAVLEGGFLSAYLQH